MNATADATLKIRLSSDLKQDVKAFAEKTKRSINNIIVDYLKELTQSDKEDEYVDEELMKDIERSRKYVEEGKGTRCKTWEESLAHLESL